MPRKNKSIPHSPYVPHKAYETKRRYASEKEALEIASYQMLLRPAVELGVYQCTRCSGWHLTNIGKNNYNSKNQPPQKP